jgi:hypothetical protein
VKFWRGLAADNGRDTVTCLRSVLMKPEHLDWVEQILAMLRLVSTKSEG